MRKDETYIRKIGRSLSSGLLLAILCLQLPSCTDDDAVLPATGETCKAILRLNVSSFGSRGTDGMTRSVAGNSDEDLVKDLWVFQFSTLTKGLLKDPVYISSEQLNGDVDEIEIDFTQNSPGESSIVCAVANTHDGNWATDENNQTRKGFATYTEFQQQALPADASQPFLSSNMGATGGYTIPMYGTTQITIAAKTYIRVPLVRMFARVHVYVDPSYPNAHHMSIKSITYSNVPLYSRVKGITEKNEYPDNVEWKEYVEEGADDFTLYIPENIQGVVEEMTSKSTADKSLFPKNALAIKVDMIHASMSENPTGNGHIHEYTVYPGGDMKNDFNIRRNCIYNVIIKLVSEPDKDTIVP